MKKEGILGYFLGFGIGHTGVKGKKGGRGGRGLPGRIFAGSHAVRQRMTLWRQELTPKAEHRQCGAFYYFVTSRPLKQPLKTLMSALVYYISM